MIPLIIGAAAAVGVVGGVGKLLALQSERGAAPGLVEGKLASVGSKPNAVCSEAGTPEARAVAPFKAATLDAVLTAINATGGKIVTQQKGYAAAVYTSALMGYVDDVELRVSGKTVHIRSASRVGYSDRGVNRARVEEIRDMLGAEKIVSG